MDFDIAGPFELSRHGNNQMITKQSLKELRAELEEWDEGLSEACGCYVFAVRAGRGYTPYYVGQASKRAIADEALNASNREKYNVVLGFGRGRPMLFILPLLPCEVEPDLAIIDEMLYRRHTGSQDGVGRSQWDPEGKSFFLQRTGKASFGLGEAIERALKTEHLIPEATELPWSNLERLFSSEPIRKRAGFSFANGSLVYLTDKPKNMATLRRVADDMASQKIVLGDLWNNTSKSRYLDRLKNEGLEIDVAPIGRLTSVRKNNDDGDAGVQVSPYARKGRTPNDKHLISSADKNPFLHRAEFERGERIWRELQFTLQFDEHDNAIAVLMRVLLELAITYYARDHGLVFSSGDYFAKRVSSVADSLSSRGLIDSKARNIIRKFESDKPIVSAHSMHQYVHNPDFHPSKSDMKAIWNVIRVVIINSAK